jgi:hypothetical protein
VERLTCSKRYYREVQAASSDEAIEIYRREIGYLELQSAEMVRVDLENSITALPNVQYHVSLRVHLTGKGQKWLRYLESTGRVPQ